MHKRTFTRTLAVFILLLFFSQSTGAYFSDVSAAGRYYTAIQYLQINNIIGGYPDGTFRPLQNVTRSEFLKIMVGALGKSADISTPTGFKDVDETAWYAPYVRKARQLGWITGYPDGTFRPAQYVSKAEAVKILVAAEAWALPENAYEQPYLDTPPAAWFTPYIYAARQKNLLEETGRFYSPEAFMSRGQVSELLFRTAVTAENNAEKFSVVFLDSLVLPEPAVEPSAADTPAAITAPASFPLKEYSPAEIRSLGYKTVSADYFEGLELNSGFPNIFFQNELYYFEGKINAGAYKQIFAFLAPEGASDPDKYLDYPADVVNGTFKIPVIFSGAGKFRLGIIPGESGESKVVDITVLAGLPKAGAAANTLAMAAPLINYQNLKTTVSWKNNGNNISRIIFTQGSRQTWIFSRQNIETVNLDYPAFSGFSSGSVDLKIEGAKAAPEQTYELTTAWSASAATRFTAASNTFGEIDPLSITAANFPYTKSALDKISFSGAAKTEISPTAYIIKPDGSVDSAPLTTSSALKTIGGREYIPAGAAYSFSYTPASTGTYSLEINNADGLAVLNLPVYLKNGLPLIPNYFDLHRNDPPVENYDLAAYRTQLLKMVNAERTAAGLKPVIADGRLNTLAQNHAADMVSRNFFGHINPDGLSPDDRRLAAGIMTPVGENLADTSDIYFAHYGLMQSAIHRKNILDPYWTKLGIGMAKHAPGSFYTAEEFSYDPLNDAELAEIKKSIIIELNKSRALKNLAGFLEVPALNTIAQAWSGKMAELKFYDFESPDGETLSGLIYNSGLNKTIQSYILQGGNRVEMLAEILDNDEVYQSRWREIGIGLKTDDEGTFKATLLFSF